MSLVMLAGAALFVRAEYRLVHADPGFETEHVLLVVPRLRVPPQTPGTIAAFHRTLADRLRAIPAVRAVAHTSTLPIGDDETAAPAVIVRAAGETSDAGRMASANVVSPEFFDALSIPIVRGKLFDPRDAADSLPPVVVSETLARAVWPARDPVGERLDVGGRVAQVVGVARDIRSLTRGGGGVPTVYQPRAPESDASAIVIRFQGDAAAAAAAVRGVIAELDPDALAQPRTLAAIRDDVASRFMRLVANVVFLGLVAGVLAVIGIYAVVAFAMSRRTKEIGIRVALGATRADILRLVMASGMKPVVAGLAAGTVIALLAAQALMKVMANAPVPLEPRNPTTYAAVAFLLAGAAVAAMLGPAYRAASADPVDALRHD